MAPSIKSENELRAVAYMRLNFSTRGSACRRASQQADPFGIQRWQLPKDYQPLTSKLGSGTRTPGTMRLHSR